MSPTPIARLGRSATGALLALSLVGCDSTKPTDAPTPTPLGPVTTPVATPKPVATPIPPTPGPTVATGWQPGPSLHQGRRDHSATLLDDGSVLVVGGWQYLITPDGQDSVEYLSSAELLTDREEVQPGEPLVEWRAAKPMPTVRSGQEAIRLHDGRVLVFGGTTMANPPYADPATSAVIYDPARDRWKVIAGPPLDDPTGAVLLPDGRVVTVGLRGTANPLRQGVAIFDPATLAWHRGSDHANGSYRPAMALLSDGSVLVAGGMYPRAELPSPTSETWVYDPATDEWSRKPDLPEPALTGPGVRLRDGKVLLVAGQTSSLYDAATSTWSTVAPPPQYRDFTNIVGLLDGRVLIAGADSCRIEPDTTEVYDPITDRWASGTVAPAIGGASLTLLADGSVMLVGGVMECLPVGQPSVALRDAQILDPTTLP